MKDTEDNLESRKGVLFAECVGRLYACSFLEEKYKEIQDSNWSYGWGMLLAESMIRTCELSIKLLYILDQDKHYPRGHDLTGLWSDISEDTKERIECGDSFADFSEKDYRDYRYSNETLVGGKSKIFDFHSLYAACLSILSLAEESIGNVLWPWSGHVAPHLRKYKVHPIRGGALEVIDTCPPKGLEWSGAIVRSTRLGEDIKYIWTLYFGFTREDGMKESFEVDQALHPEVLKSQPTETVAECLEKIDRAYQQLNLPAILHDRRQPPFLQKE